MNHFVLDTSYLLHIFKVPGRSSDADHLEVWSRFEVAALAGSTFYVPVPVVFEFCNFVVQVADGMSRVRLAKNLRDAIDSSIRESAPWTITPFEGDDSMEDWSRVLSSAISEFHNNYIHSEIGLTDIAVIKQARRLKAVVQQRPHPQPLIHIWTTDAALKANEPDNEPQAFVG